MEHDDHRGFRHPNLEQWTVAHRGELMSAALTILRSWFAAGSPEPEHQTFGFGSFEEWQRELGGVLENAGVEGFLSNVHDFRDESAVDRKAWQQHLADLHGKYGTATFVVDDVRKDVINDEYTDPLGWHEGMPDPAKERRKYNWHLGNLYRGKRDVWADGRVLRRRDGIGHSGRVKW